MNREHLVEALGNAFGRQDAVGVLKETIGISARQHVAELAQAMGGSTMEHFKASLAFWSQDNALEMEMLKHDRQNLHFNVTRCRYAEMYEDLSTTELGCLLSCNRDHALIEGFNPDIALVRTQTIMEGAPYCDFRYTVKNG